MAVPDSRIIKVSSLTEYVDQVIGLKKRAGSIIAFRGQRNHTWDYNPALLRPSGSILASEKDAVRDVQSIHPQEFYSDMTMFDKLVRMQHYGLPTRLMDVTSNPLVSLFFATAPMTKKGETINGRIWVYDVPKIRQKYYDSDAVFCVANLSNLSDQEKAEIVDEYSLKIDEFNNLNFVDRLCQFIRSEKSHFRPLIQRKDLFKPYYVIPKMQNRRIIAQQGAFIIFGLGSKRVPKGSATDQAITVQVIDVPQSEKANIRRDLDKLGITNANLFPELESAMPDIIRKYS